MAVDYKKKIGFNGPVPHRAQAEGADQAPVRLRRRGLPQLPAEYGLLEHFKLNIETNHATLAGHTMMHELDVRRRRRRCSARSTPTRGDPLLGWDTDQFPTDIYLTTQIMLVLLEDGRLHHRRRQLRRQGPPRELRAGRPVPRPHRRHGRLRPRPQDRAAIRKDGRLDEFVKDRYSSFDSGIGAKIEAGKTTFADSRNTCSQERRHSRQAAARKCSRISSTTMSGEACAKLTANVAWAVSPMSPSGLVARAARQARRLRHVIRRPFGRERSGQTRKSN